MRRRLPPKPSRPRKKECGAASRNRSRWAISSGCRSWITGDSTIGFVRDVNQGWFFGRGGRLVGVPIEVVAILARQVNLLDSSREDFARALTWSNANGMQIPRDEKIQIALGRR